MRDNVQAIVNQFGLGISVKELAVMVYDQLVAQGEDVYILNERYIGVNGDNFQLVKSKAKGQWIVKEF